MNQGPAKTSKKPFEKRIRSRFRARANPTWPSRAVWHDANLNVTTIGDSTLGNIRRMSYTPFGVVTFHNGSGTPVASDELNWKFLHQGGERDAQTGLYQFRNRIYSPTLGRWMQVDPIGYAAGDVNLYGYVGNNGVNLSDAIGFKPDVTSSPNLLWLLIGIGGNGIDIIGQILPGILAKTLQLSLNVPTEGFVPQQLYGNGVCKTIDNLSIESLQIESLFLLSPRPISRDLGWAVGMHILYDTPVRWAFNELLDSAKSAMNKAGFEAISYSRCAKGYQCSSNWKCWTITQEVKVPFNFQVSRVLPFLPRRLNEHMAIGNVSATIKYRFCVSECERCK
jgi:RHS repeat-associated protein